MVIHCSTASQCGERHTWEVDQLEAAEVRGSLRINELA